MTDAKIVNTLLSRVMKVVGYSDGWWLKQLPDGTVDRSAHGDWNPLTSDADAMAVVDKMAEDAPHVFLGRYAVTGHWICAIHLRVRTDYRNELAEGLGVDTDRRRAICKAALRALDAWEE